MKNFSDIPEEDRTPNSSGNINCSFNELTSLEGAPKEVDGFFACSYNRQLTSLKGAPEKVGSFFCSNNQLTSLKYAPKEVNGNFNCYGNELTSLKGVPKKINGDFYCYDNPLKTIKDLKDTKGIKILGLSESDYMKMNDYLEEIFENNIKCEFIKIEDKNLKIILNKNYIEAKVEYIERKFNTLD